MFFTVEDRDREKEEFVRFVGTKGDRIHRRKRGAKEV